MGATSGGAQAHKAEPKQARRGKVGKSSAVLTLLLATLLGVLSVGPGSADPMLSQVVQGLEKQLLATPTPASAPRTTAAKPLKTVPHDVAGHMPHDPNCEACRRARMVAPPAHRTRDPRAVSDSDRGFVLGLDLYGPFSADVGEHVYALVGVETGRTDYGMVRLLKDRTALACREALKSMRHELRSMSSDPKVDLVRVHADDDSSFKGECGEYIAGEGLRSTDTGGYCPTKNSRTERRIRMINEAFRANLLVATGGTLWWRAPWRLP